MNHALQRLGLRQPAAALATAACPRCGAGRPFVPSPARRPKAALFLSLLLVLSAGHTRAQEEQDPIPNADGFHHFGDYVVLSRLKITGDRVTKVAIKPLRLSISTDGVSIRISTDADAEEGSLFTIYRSDGIGRQRLPGGPLEVVPGIQAVNDSGGAHRHLRLTRDTLTLTVFPGVSDQTIVTHATVAPAPPPAASPNSPER